MRQPQTIWIFKYISNVDLIRAERLRLEVKKVRYEIHKSNNYAKKKELRKEEILILAQILFLYSCINIRTKLDGHV